MFKKYSAILILFSITTASAFSQLSTNIKIYKNVSELPSFLKLVTPAKELHIPAVAIQPKNKISNVTQTNSNNNLSGILGTLAPGMKAESATPVSAFSNRDDGLVVLLDPLITGSVTNHKAVYTLKTGTTFTHLISGKQDVTQLNRAMLNAGWKTIKNSDGSFYLASNTSGFRLGVTSTMEVKMMEASENNTTNFILYEHNKNQYASTPMWLYNPSSRCVLGKKIIGSKVILSAIKVADALSGKIPGDVSIQWDFVTYIPYWGRKITSYFDSKRNCDNPDKDGDGSDGMDCGGLDCDDSDNSRAPGRPELCDPDGKDEDCDPTTFGKKDRDGDGYFDINCFNTYASGDISRGTDCDDLNPAIIPGAQIYISETRIEVCGIGICEVGAGFKAVYQPNGTAVVVPR